MTEQPAQHPGDDHVRYQRIDEWQKGARTLAALVNFFGPDAGGRQPGLGQRHIPDRAGEPARDRRDQNSKIVNACECHGLFPTRRSLPCSMRNGEGCDRVVDGWAQLTPVSPAILHTSFHSGPVTGWTESREYLTSAMSLSFGSAFTAASVTGFGTGFTAFTSTALNTPFSSVGSV